MNITIKKVDYYLGFFLTIFFSPFAFLIEKIILRTPTHFFKKNIVFIKLLGGGSLIMAYPSILSIKKKFPSHRLILICFREVGAYAEILDAFDQVIIINKKNIFAGIYTCFVAFIKSSFSKYVINLEIHSKLSSIFSMLLFGKKTTGLYFTFNKWQKFFINTPVFYNPHAPIFKGYESLAISLNAKIVSFKDAQTIFKKKLPKKKIKKNKLIIAPFCSSIYKEREFSSDNWISILKEEKVNYGTVIYIIGGNSDLKESIILEGKIKALLGPDCVENLTGKTSLKEVIMLLLGAKKLITIDSGILYLARLMKIRTTAYWGPSNPSLRIQEENRKLEKNIYKKIVCSPCVHLIDKPPCNGNNICMKVHINIIQNNEENINWIIK
jgi:ADP-heptose:LPS heptosyltransferase